MKQSGSRFLAVLLRFRCVCCVRFQLGRSRSAEVRPLALALFVCLSLFLFLSRFIYLSCLLSLSLPLLFGSLVRRRVCPPTRFSVDEGGGRLAVCDGPSRRRAGDERQA